MNALRSLWPSKASLLSIRRTSLRREALPQEAKSLYYPDSLRLRNSPAHELAHEMRHRDERRNSTSRRSREIEAEAVAFVVCHAIGLETRGISLGVPQNCLDSDRTEGHSMLRYPPMELGRGKRGSSPFDTIVGVEHLRLNFIQLTRFLALKCSALQKPLDERSPSGPISSAI